MNKEPPFEGKGKESDKGFKDALLWESIFDFKRKQTEKIIILYSNDNILKMKYHKLFNESLDVVKDESDIRSFLEKLKDSNKIFEEETLIYDRINKIIMNGYEVKKQYRLWMEDMEAYGAGIKVLSVGGIEIINTLKNSDIDFHTEAEYYIRVKIQSILRYGEERESKIFNPILHIGVNLSGDSITIGIEGIEGRMF
ncbi:DUF4935 domain-containing protein [Clostridium gasigenes]|nr:DUF4935 domain-containing protein [Clostridium gasigenes]